MNMEEIENYISELESMFELSELEEHSRNILKVGIYIKQLQQENSRLKEELEELKHKHYLIQGGRGNGKTYLLHLQQENQELKEVIDKSIELNEQVIKYIKEFYRPTKDKIYGGTLINIAEQNLKILKEVDK